MSAPRLSKDDLWARVCRLHNQKTIFRSLVRFHEYLIPKLDELTRTYTIKYESGNMLNIPIDDLYAAYKELYRIGRLPRGHLKNKRNGLRIFGHIRYSNAPGATIYAILPKLDDAIHIEDGGHLFI